MERGLRKGLAPGDLFLQSAASIGPMEAGVLRSAERAGRIEAACEILARYHEALDGARRAVLRKAAYPIFLLHFGILVLSAPEWITRGPGEALAGVGTALAWVYAGGIALFALASAAVRGARTSRVAEILLGLVPVAGGTFRNLALGRFTFAYESAIEAGVNAPSSLESAGLASGAASLADGARRVLPAVRGGASVADGMRGAGGFPTDLVRAFEVGEATGRIDAELRRVREQAFERGAAGIDVLSEWLPRLLYIGVALAMAWRILETFQGAMGQYRGLLDF
jgi:type II secretory pathway component PulF